MAEKYAWSRRSDDDIWHGGPCSSIRECVEEALAEGYQLSDTFAIGIIEPYSIDTNFADMLLERMQEQAYDEVGEVTDGWLDYIPSEDIARLDERLNKVIHEWLKEVNEEPTFYSIAPCREYTLGEAIEEHKERTINTPKGGKFNLEEVN